MVQAVIGGEDSPSGGVPGGVQAKSGRVVKEQTDGSKPPGQPVQKQNIRPEARGRCIEAANKIVDEFSFGNFVYPGEEKGPGYTWQQLKTWCLRRQGSSAFRGVVEMMLEEGYLNTPVQDEGVQWKLTDEPDQQDIESMVDKRILRDPVGAPH
mmetsp:Transcript_45186/g.112236  ORF Transcript_45186/g.112236 Transcript_45186/m.112236 type:complete len:153 (-) Transcript_45186:162-620(-)